MQFRRFLSIGAATISLLGAPLVGSYAAGAAEAVVSDTGDAASSIDVTSSTLHFDADTITIDVNFAALGNPYTSSDWTSGKNIVGIDLSFNGSDRADGVLVFGAKNGRLVAVGENQRNQTCGASASVNGNTLRISTSAECFGRPGQISYNVLTNTDGSIDTAPNSGFSNPVSEPGGYWLLGADGGIFSFGNAPFFGSTGSIKLNKPVVGMSPSPGADGYRFVASDGGVFSYGNAPFKGSMGGQGLNKPVVGMATTRSGKGYWLVASDGGIFAFGDADFFGSTGGMKLNRPIVGMVPTADGRGYWLIASDGGIFAFGNADFFGSTGGMKLNQPITAMAPTASGRGYYLLGKDGGVFSFGDAGFQGSAAGKVVGAAIGMSVDGAVGYRITDSAGTVHEFGKALHFGDLPDHYVTPNSPIVGMAQLPR